MDISVCIVSWNTKGLLRKCIQSIYDKTSGLNYEIIVVDNNSRDGSPDMVAQEYPECKIIRAGQNLGFARANNLAVRQAASQYILYLNPDTELKTNAIYGMFKYLEKNCQYGAVGCKLLNTDGTIQYTCARLFPSPFNQFCELAGLNRLFPNTPMFSAIEMHYWDHNGSMGVDCISGACMMMKKKLVDSLGGFDENIFMYAEDVDLCYRIKKKGWKIYYLAEEEIVHHVAASTKQKSNRHFSTIKIRESNAYYLKKHFGQSMAFRYRAAVLLGCAIRLGIIPVYVLSEKMKRTNAKPNTAELINKYIILMKWSVGMSKQMTV